MGIKQRGPSAFSDSPEDLISRAEDFAEREDVPRDVCQLLVDIARSLSKEREDRVRYTNLAQEAMASERRAVGEIERLLNRPIATVTAELLRRASGSMPHSVAEILRRVAGELDAHGK